MAASTFPAQANSMFAFYDELWQVPWGEADTIASLKEEIRTAEPQPVINACYELPAFQPVAFVLFSVQPEQNASITEPQQAATTRTSLVANARAFVPCSSNTQDATPLVSTESDHASPVQAVTRENFEGELPSIGSDAHFDGTCKRCAFFPKGRCTNGKDCTHCHFPHEPRSRMRKRTLKGQRGGCHEEEISVPMPQAQGFDALSEVLAYLQEPVAPCESKQQQQQQQQPLAMEETGGADVRGEAIMANFNNALEQIAEAYLDSSLESNVKSRSNSVDVDTTPSVSALSDGEDSATMSSTESKKSTPSDTSDSEVVLAELDSSTPTSWLAMQRSRKAAKQQSNTTVEIARMTRALLNKLTEQRFESLCAQMIALPLSTPEQLAIVVAEIFQKATTQDGFRSLYTELCIRLDAHFSPQPSAIGGKAFRKALVTECQATFERNLQPADASVFVGLDEDDCFEVEMKIKTRRIGNMRFIGDLLVRKLLAPKLLPPIVHELLNGDEAALESLIALLAVVSPKFEAKASLHQASLRDAFAVLRRKITDKSVCSRLSCQINDLFDAKARGWAPRTISA